MIEVLPPLGKYKYDFRRILPVKCCIDNFVRLRSCIRNVNSVASASTPVLTDHKADNKLMGTLETEDKEVAVDPNNLDKKLQISDNLDPK
jgi:hypothetical protein